MKHRRLMSRILAVVIVMSMAAAALSSCGGGQTAQTAPAETAEAEGGQDAQEAPSEESEPEGSAPEEPAPEEPVPEESGQEEPAYSFDEPWQYYVTEEETGIRYDFEEVVIMLPLSWKDRYTAETTEYGVRFADTASMEKWREEGMDGGTLFYLERIGLGEEFQGPNFDVLGETDQGQYLLIYPSDVQAYYAGGDDKSYLDNYMDLYEQISYVEENSYVIER